LAQSKREHFAHNWREARSPKYAEDDPIQMRHT